MNSIAIIRATDILEMKSTLQEMIRVGLNFECKPKEINPAYTEKILSKSCKTYEVCALVPIIQDYELSLNKIKSIPPYSQVHLINDSNQLFNELVKLIPLLPDLVIPTSHKKGANKQIAYSKAAPVFLGVFVNRKVQVQTCSGALHTGILKHADSIGVFFEPEDDSSALFITWHDIKKIIIPRDEKK
jgi:hypothetical protein